MNLNRQQYKLLFRILQFATIAVFVGRGYQHIFWDAPFRTLLWDEVWMSGLVEGFSAMSWEEFSTSLDVDDTIQGAIQGFGYFYLICALVALFIKKTPRFFQNILVLGAGSLVFLAALYCKEKFFSAGQFFEYTLQFTSPLLLLYWHRKIDAQDPEIPQPFMVFVKIAIVLTFTCHGLYALNFYPIPGSFMDMTINILGVSDDTARLFLKGAGILDFVISFALIFNNRIALFALGYAILWGFATSIARVWAHFYKEMAIDSLHQWWHETFYRFPHFLIPLFLLLLLYWNQKREVFQNQEEDSRF